jgi:hypothetical protein
MNWFVILFYGKVIYGRDVFVFRQYEHFSLHLVAVGYGQPCHKKDHFGIIVSKELPLGETIRKTSKILLHYSPQSIKNQILFL